MRARSELRPSIAQAVGTIKQSGVDRVEDMETTVQDTSLPAVVARGRCVNSDQSSAVRPTHAGGSNDFSDRTAKVAPTTQSAHHPELIPQGADVLRTVESSESVLKSAQREQTANSSGEYDDDDPAQVVALLAEYILEKKKIKKFGSGVHVRRPESTC